MPETVYYFVDAVEANRPLFMSFEFWTALATLLGSFTAALATFFAWRSARVIAKQSKIHDRAYLAFGAEIVTEFYVKTSRFILRIPLKNIGKLPLYYQVSKLTVNGQDLPAKDFDQKIALFPESQTSIFTTYLAIPAGQSSSNFFITARAEVFYWDVGKNLRKLGRTFEIRPHPAGNGRSWTNYKDDFFD